MYWHQVINTWRNACNVNSVLRWCLNQWSDEVNYYSSTKCLDGQNVCIIYSICVLKSVASAKSLKRAKKKIQGKLRFVSYAYSVTSKGPIIFLLQFKG